jgi:ribosomal protein S18 acetylase RimI-like enzyme
MNKGISFRPYRAKDLDAVVALWREAGLLRPQNDPVKDIARKMKVNPEWFLVAEHSARIIGTIMVGYDGHRGWINYLAVDPACHRGGIGRLLMTEAERILREAGCPKINLLVRAGNAAAMDFYRRIGFAPDEAVSFGKRLVQD